MESFIEIGGVWLGEGKIILSTSPEIIKFYMKWEIHPLVNETIHATQMIQMQGVEEKVVNAFCFTFLSASTFNLALENPHLELVQGCGTITENTIEWKFLNSDTFSGSETYKKLKTDEFFLQAEYGSELYRTHIEGILWQKST